VAAWGKQGHTARGGGSMGGGVAVAARGEISAASRHPPLQIKKFSKFPPLIPYIKRAFPGAVGASPACVN
jgi:hypothetical protein